MRQTGSVLEQPPLTKLNMPDDARAAVEIFDRNCMHDRICWTILDRISDGRYQPGDRLKELTLAREFQVSQAPVREALRKLEAIGAVVSEPYRGTRVRAITLREMRENYELRGILEQAAMQLAVDGSRIDMAVLEREFAAMQAAAQSGDLQAVAIHNKNFHCHIVLCCGNQELVRVWKSLGVGLRARLNIQRLADAGRLMKAVDSHRKVLDALHAGDLLRTGDLLREHANSFVMDDADPSASPADGDVRQ
jgi:DNA-binding GntR family transcriptional regulator